MLRRLFVLLALLLVACPTVEPEPEPTPAPEPEAGPFMAGAASALMDIPVGIGTAGNSFLGGPDSDSPYSDSFPATRRVHAHPDVRAVMYSRGEGFEVILVRIDMIASIQQLRDAVLLELLERTGNDWDDALVLSATHSHSGPGRFIQGFFSIIADDFFPAHYERLVHTIADTIEAAHADLAPAELAVVRASAPDGHNDRRCADGVLYTNDDTPLLAVRKEGSIESVVVSYAIHGTTIGIDDLTLSQDVSGAIETFTEAELASPDVMVMMMNSWAADVSVGNPTVPAPDNATPMPDGYDKLERVGSYMAGVVSSALTSASYEAEPTIEGRTYRYPIGHSEMGYELGEYPYIYGAIYCQGGDDCDDSDVPFEPTSSTTIDEACVPFPETSPAPPQTIATVGRIGGSHFTTWSGECGTLLAEETMAGMAALDGVEDVIFFGYANDYLGYALQYDDWYYGGYEASGAMWGPRQGQYMSRRSIETMTHYVEGGVLPYDQPAPIELFDLSEVPEVPVETALDGGTVVSQPNNAGAGETVTATVYGSDPWHGTPTAVLQSEGAGGWTDVVTPSGAPYQSNSLGFWVDLAVDPEYTDDDVLPMTRHFSWTFSMARTSRFSELTGLEADSYRLRITVPTEGKPLEVTTDTFELQ
ncbi:MAG: neutral/alkaline non-lysosomal ceramidase N-terminal domain-containing protein [Deltaproteobacteria bacterium]|nr:neutral/alkaline non-lysosomal ceramidase N-terminal domain-containing protein [Deltaproteobacteria bacterium]